MEKEPLFINRIFQSDVRVWKLISPIFLLGLVLSLGIFFRFYDIGTESYWIDEMSTVVEGQQSVHQLLTSGRLDQPIAYYLPFHLWVHLFGSNEGSTRAFSALAGMGSIILLYIIGRELFGMPIGLISAFLMVISEYQIYYSQQARFYSFFEFTCLLSFLFFILALTRERKIFFLFYGFSNIALMYSHTYGVFIIAAQALYFIVQWKKYRGKTIAWLLSHCILLAAIVPYYFTILTQGNGITGTANENIGGLDLPSIWDPIRSIYRFILSARGDRGWDVMLANYMVAGGVVIIGCAIYFFRQKEGIIKFVKNGLASNLQEIPDIPSKIFLMSCWLLFPILAPLILSVLFFPIYLDRYMIGAAPALYLLIAFSVFVIRKAVPLLVSLTAIIIMIVPSLVYYYETDIHEQWKESAAYVYENAQPDDVIVFAPNQGIGVEQETFNWYYQGSSENYGLGSNLSEEKEISNALDKFTFKYDRLWVIIRDNPNGSSDRYKEFFLRPDQDDMRLLDTRNFIGISVYLFELTHGN